MDRSCPHPTTTTVYGQSAKLRFRELHTTKPEKETRQAKLGESNQVNRTRQAKLDERQTRQVKLDESKLDDPEPDRKHECRANFEHTDKAKADEMEGAKLDKMQVDEPNEIAQVGVCAEGETSHESTTEVLAVDRRFLESEEEKWFGCQESFPTNRRVGTAATLGHVIPHWGRAKRMVETCGYIIRR